MYFDVYSNYCKPGEVYEPKSCCRLQCGYVMNVENFGMIDVYNVNNVILIIESKMLANEDPAYFDG
ncbi:2080_t:CDS:1 [Dentiscutata erythropus]|uniref:2080_t:CDS:1 n=1 Tax=Dentiscutata erythropus TaxID=1348616 RepID=A0A9N9K5G8_9GLOM|nr:2080_t:CDS:1 [Dentiscutata erythropus]